MDVHTFSATCHLCLHAFSLCVCEVLLYRCNRRENSTYQATGVETHDPTSGIYESLNVMSKRGETPKDLNRDVRLPACIYTKHQGDRQTWINDGGKRRVTESERDKTDK